MATKKDILPSILNKIRTTYQNSINDNQGWVRGGKFTPLQQVQRIGSDLGYQARDTYLQTLQNAWSPGGTNYQATKAIQGGINKLSNLPRVELFKQQREQIQNPILKTGANLAVGIPESIVNIPRNYVTGIARTGQELGTAYKEGRKIKLQNLAGGIAPLAESLIDIGTFGGGTVAKNLLKEGAKQGIKKAILKQGAKGAGMGALGGLTYGLDTQYGKKFNAGEVAQNVAGGALLGGVIGGGLGGVGAIKNKLFGGYKSLGIDDKIANELTNKHFIRSENRQIVFRQPKAQKEFEISINKVLGKPLNSPVYSDDLKKYQNITLKLPDTELGVGNTIKVKSNKPIEISQLEPKIEGGKSTLDKITEPLIKTDLDTKQVEERLLPWEEPSYVSKNLGVKTKESPVLKTGILKQELNQLQTKAPLKSQPIISPELTNDIKKVENIAPKKVNLIDWFRTPDRVLNKIGLGNEAKQIRTSYNKYLDELPVEISKVTKWYDQVKADPTASQRIFKYLDGQDTVLNKNETKVVGEIQNYLKEWADKLGLPEDKRVTNYITHIFEKDFIKKDFDEDLAKIIADKVPGSVYDPFTQERLGKQGYIEDVFKSLDAYIKRGVRKVNMDPALEKLSNASNKLPLESWKYVKSFADRVNLRPTTIDTYIDDLVKQSPVGYKLGARPVTSTTRKLRQAVYRGTLGMNVGSALRNLTQGVNTYAELGEKYTPIGYIRNLKEMATGGDELKRVGVLRDDLIQDRQLSAVKGVMQKLDEGLFAFFNLAEKINRGSAYFGAKAKYLDQGLNEKEAIEKAVELVRKTQFTFGSVDTPVAMQSDLAKTLGQFQSFNLKQAEFLGEKIAAKDVVGLLRWVGGNALMMFTVGNLIGIDVQDIIPFGGVLTGETKLGVTPPVQLGSDIYGAITNAPDKYGNISEDNMIKRVGGAIAKNAPAWIPAGVQAKKTIQGIKAVGEEGSFSKAGRLQYPIEKTPENYIRAGLFGKSNLPAAREYFDSNSSVLGEKQTEFYKQSTDKQGVYKSFMTKRQEENAIEEAKKQLETTGGTQNVNGKILYEKDGDIKTVDINKVTSMPEQTTYQKALKEKQKYTLIDDVFNLPEEQQIEALQALGISADDATYYNTAKQENYLKSIYVEEEIRNRANQGAGKDEILNYLSTLRRGVNEKILLSDGVITDLVDKNIISYQDGKNLKNIDKDLKPKALKAKKISVSRGKISAKKYTSPKSKLKVKKAKKFKMPNYVKANFTTPKKLL